MSSSDPSGPLLQRARAGDLRALGEIHDRYYAKLYRYALLRLGEPAAAEDIASEVFVQLLQALPTERAPHTSLGGWLFGVAAHLVANHFRRAPRESEPLREDQLTSASPAQEAEQHLQHEQVRRALRRLTPDQQAVLALRFGNGFSVEETAELLGKSSNAVKVLQFRATASLRRILVEAHDD